MISINQLPPEIIIHILQISSPSQEEYVNYLFVCKWWRDVLTQNAFLKNYTYRGTYRDMLALCWCERSINSLHIKNVYDSNFILIPPNVVTLKVQNSCILDSELCSRILKEATLLKTIIWENKKYDIKSDHNGHRRIYNAEIAPHTGEASSSSYGERNENTDDPTYDELEAWSMEIEETLSWAFHEEEWDEESQEIDYP